MSLVNDPQSIRLAMLGMVEGNGHPYSWSAIVNGGYDARLITEGGYPGIVGYLDAEPRENLGIPGVKVTHIWCEDPADAERVARASLVPNVVAHPQDVIGQVDAVVIPTDVASQHVERARPFIEAGLPLFIDKPLADREDHLRQFIEWHRQGKVFMSTSCFRYCKEYAQLRARLGDVGELRLITNTTHKTWDRYGIHILEGVYPFLAPGAWLSVSHTGGENSSVVHIRHASDVEVVLVAISDILGSFGALTAYGTKGLLAAKFTDTFHAFKAQLVAFVEYLRTGRPPVAFEETTEMMKVIIAGIRSRQEGGRTVRVSEVGA
jgi:predicted dehydrogenase